ncbi:MULTISPECIES: S1 RNA-binding domain-containing protein [Pelosinus]|uniref:RNA binding S1 domain protein n=1 Tax=Pelosinus fermentans B4 TaxID=1149862 RepID=I9LGM1_9FIRM|nr:MULTISPECIES: S1 RNA-binding domain-containing protein [Pelosinus]EIW19649.1 RNA binding S1 domain protein [Pelosinus fermentans B4]EIW24608.1 RNA binding S1 domain protein [Pelosinus fermentans A11]OAM95927.1 RNA binding S1 domain protein [Pelosinus fermentans DSM 17108]SDR34443.1 S1 RNA binding domain protein [Pelosinus fermentans]
MSIEVGSVVEGVVTGITNFGAFVELSGGKVGLIHISEVADVYVRDVKDFLKEQDTVKVKVLSVDERGKIGLSIKQLQPPSPSPAPSPIPRRAPANDNRRFGKVNAPSFEDKLTKFLKDSDERLGDLKRNTESKRGGRGAARSQ